MFTNISRCNICFPYVKDVIYILLTHVYRHFRSSPGVFFKTTLYFIFLAKKSALQHFGKIALK